MMSAAFLFNNKRTSGTFIRGDRANAWGSAAPTTGTWQAGDFVWNSAPSTNEPLLWRCNTAGTPGTWEAIPPSGGGAGGNTSIFTDNTNGNGLDDCTIVHNDGNATITTVNLRDAFYACKQYGGIFLEQDTGVTLSLGGGRELVTVMNESSPSGPDNVVNDVPNNRVTIADGGDYKVTFTASCYFDTNASALFDVEVNGAQDDNTTWFVEFPTGGFGDSQNIAHVSLVTCNPSSAIQVYVDPSVGGDLTFTSAYLTVERMS